MAHFAELDENNIVRRVIVISNADTADASGVEKEYIGAAFCERLCGGRWIQTSITGRIRKRFAWVGCKYDEELDAFIDAVKPYPSWSMNPEKALWEAPVPEPDDGKPYRWDEATLSWIPEE